MLKVSSVDGSCIDRHSLDRNEEEKSGYGATAWHPT